MGYFFIRSYSPPEPIQLYNLDFASLMLTFMFTFRSYYQAMVWRLVDVADPTLPNPTDYGWIVLGGEYVARFAESAVKRC